MRTHRIADFAVSADHRMKIKENEKRVLGPFQRTQKLWNMKVTAILIVIGALGTVLKRTRIAGNRWTLRDLPNYTISKLDQNCWKLEDVPRPDKLQHFQNRQE